LILSHDLALLNSFTSSSHTPSNPRLFEPTLLEFYETELEKKLYEEEQLRKRRARQEQAQRIREAMAQKREEKKAHQKAELSKLEDMLALRESAPEQLKAELQVVEIENVKELEKQIKKLKIKLGTISKAELESDRYSYIKIPDSELTPQQLRVKRMQIMHQQAAEQRLAKKEEKAKKKEEMAQMKTENPQIFIKMLYEKRKGLKDKIKKIKAFKEDFYVRKNKNQRMLKIIDSYLDKKYDGTDKGDAELETLNKEINNANSDVENYESKLLEVETELREVDPSKPC
jgi:chromosome segregation ATPase